MKQQFTDKNFSAKTLAQIQQANAIIADYIRQGYTLTIRQLYYRFVAGGFLENTERSYKNLVNTMSEARLAGLVDWDAIEDRTRSLRYYPSSDSASDTIYDAFLRHRVDMWESQPYYIEVWVEKEALANVVQRACNNRRVPHFSNRGYVSQSEMYGAAQRLAAKYLEHNKAVKIIHLGDHDPSGIDMSRDIEARLNLMMGGADLDFSRIALNWEQIEQYNPPPNFAKSTDSRFKSYWEEYGGDSWELDALEPAVLEQLITASIEPFIDGRQWADDLEREREERELLFQASEQWEEIVDFLGTGTE